MANWRSQWVWPLTQKETSSSSTMREFRWWGWRNENFFCLVLTETFLLNIFDWNLFHLDFDLKTVCRSFPAQESGLKECRYFSIILNYDFKNKSPKILLPKLSSTDAGQFERSDNGGHLTTTLWHLFSCQVLGCFSVYLSALSFIWNRSSLTTFPFLLTFAVLVQNRCTWRVK